MVTGERQERKARRVYLFLVALGVVAMGVAIWTRGPRVVRQAWNLIGVHQVERHAETIRRAADEQRIDPCLLAALMYVESRGNPEAVSPKGALGLFQLMPSSAGDSAKRLALPEPTRDELLSDPLLNARLAASHLRWLIRHDGPDLERVLVAYNAGRGRLRQWERDAGGWWAWRAARGPRSDALAYAQQVLDFRERFRERGVIVPASPEPETAPRSASARAREAR